MNEILYHKLKSLYETSDALRAIFYYPLENSDDYFNRVVMIVEQKALNDIEEEMKNLFCETLTVHTRDRSLVKVSGKNRRYTKLKFYMKDFNLLEISVINVEIAINYLKSRNETPVFILDKDDYEHNYTPLEEKESEFSKFDFENLCRDFFSNCLEFGYLTLLRNKIQSAIKLDLLRIHLLKMTDFYVEDRFNNTIKAGDYHEYITNLLPKEYNDLLELSYKSDSIIDMYTACFAMCTAFRKIGMQIAEKKGYEYPKRSDVETLKILRTNYKKLESVI